MKKEKGNSLTNRNKQSRAASVLNLDLSNTLKPCNLKINVDPIAKETKTYECFVGSPDSIAQYGKEELSNSSVPSNIASDFLQFDNRKCDGSLLEYSLEGEPELNHNRIGTNTEIKSDEIYSENTPANDELLLEPTKIRKPHSKRGKTVTDAGTSKGQSQLPKDGQIKGKILKRCEQQDYLQDLYRDPPLSKLPPVDDGVWRADKQKCTAEDSTREIRSNGLVWDNLYKMNLLRNRSFKNYAYYRNKQREILFDESELTPRELRRGKTPVTTHVPLELYEDGYYFACRFLLKLISLNDYLVQEIPSYKLPLKHLSQMPCTVHFLGEILKKINIYMLDGRTDKLISLPFYVAQHYEKKSEAWTWLTNEFYKLAQRFSYRYNHDFGYSEALVNYMYGRYQLLKDQDSKSAVYSFSRAYKLSKGKLWEADWVTGIIGERISVYSSYLYHVALLIEAEQISVKYPKKAEKYAEIATNVLQDGDWHPDMEEALIDLAIYKVQCKKYDEAISIMENLEKKLEKGKDIHMNMCVKILLALCYQRGSRPEKALSKLQHASEIGQQYNHESMLALVHKYLGEYYLDLGRPITARKYFTSAIIINIKEDNEPELVRNLYLYGYSKGVQYGKQYVELLVEANEPGNEAFNKLLQFLSNGKPFWEEEKEKRYVIVAKRKACTKKKGRLNASDKVYLLLKNRFGKKFAKRAMDEIKRYEKTKDYERAINLLEDPIRKQFYKTLEEAKTCKIYLTKKYREKHDMMKEKYGEYIYFDIEERFIESEKDEEKFLEKWNCIDPIIPYKKNSMQYKQAIEIIQSYLNIQPKADKVYIPYPGPEIAAKLLNTLPATDKVGFCADEQIDVSAIANELAKMKINYNEFLNSFRETLQKRFENSKIDVTSKKCSTDHLI